MLLSHHVNEFAVGERYAGNGLRFEAGHETYPACSVSVILHNGVVHLLAGAVSNGLFTQSQATFSTESQNGHIINLSAVDGTIQIHPWAFDLYIGLVQIPFSLNLPLTVMEALGQFVVEMHSTTTHSQTVDSNATLGHCLFQIVQAQIASKILPYTERDDGFVEMATLNIQNIRLSKSWNATTVVLDLKFAAKPAVAENLSFNRLRFAL